jgi:menaquinone-dependent protoporphyrinogen oxidase
MRRIASRKGLDTDTSRDYDYTDWDAVDRFARDFVTKQLAQSAA